MVTLEPFGAGSGGGLIAVDATRVYSPNGGAILACPKTGCAGGPTTIAMANAFGLAVSEGYLYFSGLSQSDGVSRLPLAGGGVEQLVPGGVGTSEVLVTGGRVIYTTSNQVRAVPVAGGASTLLYATPDGSGVNSFAASATDLYLGVNTGNLVRIPLGGGQATTLATGQGNMYVAVDGSNLYWGAYGANAQSGSAVRKMPLAGGAVTELIATSPPPDALVIDDTYVYYTSGGKVYAVAK
jgi:hypothetical protein